MPLTLPPISRRRFLAGAVAACFSGRFVGAAEADADALALLADTHIAADRAKVVLNVDLAKHLATVVNQVSDHRPAAGLMLGDLALKDGQAGDYATFTD